MENNGKDYNDQQQMKSLLILYSYHHHNTRKIAEVFAEILNAEIKMPQQTIPEELQKYDLLGFGSGIYSSKHHESILELTDNMLPVIGKKAFIFSTCGVPIAIAGQDQLDEYSAKCHSLLREKLQAKGYQIVDEFICAGFNTNSFLKIFGGINKGRPNKEDLKHAKEFATQIERNVRK